MCKTTLARIIANQIERPFYALSAVSAGKADMRKIVEQAQSEQGMTLFSEIEADKWYLYYLSKGNTYMLAGEYQLSARYFWKFLKI